jgi:hypothetical protein
MKKTFAPPHFITSSPNHFLALLTAIFLLNGCGNKPAAKSVVDSHGHGSNSPSAFEFNPGKGLNLGETARLHLGLQTAEVITAKIVPVKRSTALVFRLPQESGGKYYRPGFAYAAVPVTAAEADKIRLGQPVTLAQGEGQFYPAIVQRLDRQMQEMSGRVELILEIAALPMALTLNTALEALWQEASAPLVESLSIPHPAVLQTARGNFVYVENSGFYLRTPVQIGAIENGQVQITEGIFEGDVVVSHGAQGLYLTELQAVNAGTGCAHGH